MPNHQYPYPFRDWSSEISYPQPSSHSAASSTTTTTTTSTASSHSSASGPAPQTSASSGQTTSVPAPAPDSSPAPAPTSVPAPASASAPSEPQPAPAPDFQNSSPMPLTAPAMPRNELEGSVGTLDLQTHQPLEVIETPTSMNEAFLGSLKSMLLRNRGSFVTATFLIGTQGTAVWEGILHDVGNDHIIIYQPGRQRYIACDLYSLKYIEFYDTRRQEMCDSILRQNFSF